MTLRTEILSWIMNEIRADEALLLKVYGEAAIPEIQSLLELRVIERVYLSKGVFFEVTKIWAKPNGNGTGSRR